jgi:hypothetical protein
MLIDSARPHFLLARAREGEIGREREREREGERERERKRERCRIFLKGMTGALVPFKYLVKKCLTIIVICRINSSALHFYQHEVSHLAYRNDI